MINELLGPAMHTLVLGGGLIYVAAKGGANARFVRTAWFFMVVAMGFAYARGLASGRFDGLASGPHALSNLWGELLPGERTLLMWLAASTVCLAVGSLLRLQARRRAAAASAAVSPTAASSEPTRWIFGRELIVALAILEAALFGLRSQEAPSPIAPAWHYALLTQMAANQDEDKYRVLTSGIMDGSILNPTGSYFRQRDGRYFERLPGRALGSEVTESLAVDSKTKKAKRYVQIKNIEPSSCEARVGWYLERFKPDNRSTQIRHGFTRLELIPANGAPTNPEEEKWAVGLKDAKRFCEHYLRAYKTLDMRLHFKG